MIPRFDVGKGRGRESNGTEEPHCCGGLPTGNRGVLPAGGPFAQRCGRGQCPSRAPGGGPPPGRRLAALGGQGPERQRVRAGSGQAVWCAGDCIARARGLIGAHDQDEVRARPARPWRNAVFYLQPASATIPLGSGPPPMASSIRSRANCRFARCPACSGSSCNRCQDICTEAVSPTAWRLTAPRQVDCLPSAPYHCGATPTPPWAPWGTRRRRSPTPSGPPPAPPARAGWSPHPAHPDANTSATNSQTWRSTHSWMG